MGMRDGVSQCWWLSKKCVVNWDAWSAVGTLLAVCVAIGISIAEARRRKQDQKARAMWLRLELIQPMRTWQSDLYLLSKSLDKKRYFAAAEVLNESEQARQPLVVPAALVVSNARLHELGSAAKPLAHAVYSARELSKHGWLYVEALHELQDRSIKEDQIANKKMVEDLLGQVRALHTLVVLASEELRKPFHEDRHTRFRMLALHAQSLGAKVRRLARREK